MQQLDIASRGVHCGVILPPGAVFCPVCGEKVTETTLSEYVEATFTHCSRCKNRLEPEAKFCLHCGLAVEEMNPVDTNPAEEEDVSELSEDDEIEFGSERNAYPTLRLISTVFWVIGVFIILVGILGGIGWAILARLESWGMVIAVLGSIILAIVISLLYFAISESLRLIMDIEENQHIQVELLEKLVERSLEK